MMLRKSLIAAGLFALPAVAMAQPVSGPYVSLGAGYDYMARQHVNSFSSGGVSVEAPPGMNVESNAGWTVPLAVGWGFGNGIRVELEGMFLQANQHLGGTALTGSGTNNTYGALVNIYYDFDVGVPWMFPYIGVGAGYGWTDLNGWSGTDAGTAYSLSNSSQGSGLGQAILGVSFPIAAVPGLSATAEFRYLASFSGYTFHGGGAASGVDVSVQHASNFQGLLGLRYAFNTAPPPPPPAPAPTPVAAPAPAPARTYLVFFDWDKADLTARAKQIIAEAAQNSTRVQLTRIEVNGYTDTSGSPKYNMKLSVKRAQNVAAELVKDGVPANEITTQGFGDTHLLVPTGPNVREPQNRRVEIILK